MPATLALGKSAAGAPEAVAPLAVPPGRRTYQEISYRESAGVGYLEFSFPGGAMITGQCRPLLAAYRHAQRRPVRVIVLGGPRDVFSNGIHLNVIEAADDPAAESWRNINAINDLVEAILTTTDRQARPGSCERPHFWAGRIYSSDPMRAGPPSLLSPVAGRSG